jgi:HlyD family secretion protein
MTIISFFNSKYTVYVISAAVVLTSFIRHFAKEEIINNEMPIALAEIRNFDIDVKTVGELEAARSTVISSQVKGDQGKIIYLVPDGLTVKTAEILVKLDPTPFEEKLDSLRNKYKEQQAYIVALKKALEWEISQGTHERQRAKYEVEATQLELNKLIQGDSPLEIARLKGLMQKAYGRFEELNIYANDLKELEDQGFLNPTEIKNAQKKLQEEQENYETAQLQYENYINHVSPMQIKKAEVALDQAKIKQEETIKARGHAVGKAMLELEQAQQVLEDIDQQIRQGEKEMAMTEIQAPAPGMVVHREDYRNGQRRKPRLGDVVVRNQAIMDLPDLNSMMVKSKVREIDLCKVAVGKKASVEVDAYPQLIFNGTVTHIGVLALPDPGRASEEKYFEIRIAIDESDPRLRPGMTSRLMIHADQIQNALTVPVHAVYQEKKKSYCYVPTRLSYEKREVEIGAHNEEWAEIKSGLNSGESVCLVMPTDLQ